MDKDRFESYLQQDGMKDLVEWFEKTIRAMEERLISYDLSPDGSNQIGLAYEKCKTEGSKKLLSLLKMKIKEVKEKRVVS